jgi:hypothetical protein
MAVDFDGTNDAINVGTALTYLNAKAAVTLSLWANLDVSAAMVLESLSTGASGSLARAEVSTSVGPGNNFTCRNADGDAGSSLSGASTFSTGSWFHIAATYKCDVTRTIIIYRNGVQVDTGTAASATGSAFSATNSLQGALGVDSDLATGWFNGKLEDCRVYDRVLTPNEILTIFQSKGRDGIAFGLLARWGLNELAPGATAVVKNIGRSGPAATTNLSVPVYFASPLSQRRRAA